MRTNSLCSLHYTRERLYRFYSFIINDFKIVQNQKKTNQKINNYNTILKQHHSVS